MEIKNPDQKASIAWYEKRQADFGEICSIAHDCLQSSLIEAGVNFQTVSAHVKEVESFKIKDLRYSRPEDEIHDLVGLRVVAYTESNVEDVSRIVEEQFKIDSAHSADKSDLLKKDQVGYRSVHYIATLLGACRA